MQREDVYRLIDEERRHQNDKWGTPTEHPHEVGGWILLMEQYLDMARECWCGSRGDESALAMIRKVIALGVACFEQHGCPPGKDDVEADLRQRMTEIQREQRDKAFPHPPQGQEQPMKHDIERATCRCRRCGKIGLGMVTVKFDNEECPGPAVKCPYAPGTEDYALWWEAHHKIAIAEQNNKPINPTVTHEFNENNLCSKCGLSRNYVLSRSSPTSCITLSDKPEPR